MKLLLIFLYAAFSIARCARILGLVPFPMKSHYIVMEPLFQELAARGHEVTVFSPFPQKTPLSNFTDVDCSDLLKPLTSQFSLDMIRKEIRDPVSSTNFVFRVHQASCQIMDEPVFKDLLKAKGNYDLMITELFGSECFAYYSYKLGLPMIYFTTSMSMPWASERMGLPDNPAYIKSYNVNLQPVMTFWQRVYSTAMLLNAKFWHYLVFARQTHLFVEEKFGETLPPPHEVAKNASLLFINSYHALSQSRPFPPNVIEVGGIHIRKRQPLPKDLQNIIDKATDGVIVVSFGSLVRSASLPKQTIRMFINAFAKIPQTVIFKYEEELVDKPANVFAKAWLPQRDLAEHDKVVAIVAHGGLSSTIEAVQFGKPFVGIPFFSDQYGNVDAVARKGAGVHLDLDELTEEKISWALDQVLHNPKIKESMRELSLQFRDRPIGALQSAVFWTEYVLRHRGAVHLRPASVHLAWYQYLLLDVCSFFALSLAAILSAVYFCFKTVLARLLRTRNIVSNKKIN